jgi:hypothetical protein
MFSASFLFASLLWGSVGFGYFIYGKKQQSLSPMVGGILMITVSYFVGSALLMSLVCLGIGGAVYFLLRRGVLRISANLNLRAILAAIVHQPQESFFELPSRCPLRPLNLHEKRI